jgi:hypothetical protein
MIEVPVSSVQEASRCWMRAVAGVVTSQWELLAAQWQAGLKVMAAALGVPGGVPDAGRPPGAGPRAEPQDLERRALERVGQGLPPPPEAYASPARERIDWSRFPIWARPSDPELFVGSHEG